jgi:hypothetical protein
MVITTVTRKTFRTGYTGGWVDASRANERNIQRHSAVQVAQLTLGPSLDRDVFLAHVKLGNDAVALRDGVIEHYFEHEDVLIDLMDLWLKDCTFHMVENIDIVWDKRESDDGRQPAPL